jgi:NAD(P)-dependent dehydrogenase (short-subunit alcohol dehydrogenase family)
MTGTNNRAAIVTGGASGIGEATCHALADRGLDVAVADLDADDAAAVAEAVAAGADADVDAVGVEVDVSDEAAVEAAVERTVEAFGRLDVLVNNAAVASRQADGRVTEVEDEGYEFITGVNLRGPVYACKHAIPAMRESGEGTGAVVNNASVAALVAEPGMDVYTATKGALVSLTRSLAVEYAPEIRANTVCPGVVRTPMLESVMEEDEAEGGGGNDDGEDAESDVAANLRRMVEDTPLGMGDPAAIADAIAFLATERSRFVTGATVPVDGGFTAR